ncbi:MULTISPECIES: hypothetical protein [unclassified Pseudomonas]|jgi:hypothetical protein|uniref:hypothetical protein n=1 Tax=unclassified Pseudomonas TaxID=196821 RepID=UPI0011AF6A6B|nr:MULTISPECIES: hypothetical protein [unclassified Pseudomonas]
MLLSNFPTTAIPSVSGTLALISVARERAEGVPVLVFLLKTVSWLYLLIESKKFVTPPRHRYVKMPSRLAAFAR